MGRRSTRLLGGQALKEGLDDARRTRDCGTGYIAACRRMPALDLQAVRDKANARGPPALTPEGGPPGRTTPVVAALLDETFVEGHDLEHGWGGATATVTVPGAQ